MIKESLESSGGLWRARGVCLWPWEHMHLALDETAEGENTTHPLVFSTGPGCQSAK